MATEEQISKVLIGLADIQACSQCDTRLRFGDFECPHCGADLEDDLRKWAERIVDGIGHESS